MQATCGNDGCGRSWTLQKSPEEYADGPRCPDCGNRDVDVSGTPAANGDAAAIFDALESGAEPVELVREHGVEPGDVEEYAEAFERLSEYVVMPEGELEERIEAAKAEVREAEEEKRSRAVRRAREEASGEFNQQLNQQLTAVRREARREGYSRGWDDAEETTKTALEAEMDAELEAAVEAIEEKYRGEVSRIQEAIDEKDHEIERLREERDELAERVAVFERGDLGEVYGLGHADGVLAAPVESEAWAEGAAAVLGAGAAGR